MDRIGRNEDFHSDLRFLNLTFNFNLDLSFNKDHEFIDPMDKVGPDSSRRITEDTKAVAS